ncbi:MAG: GNAT family N-acetyltransferase [Bacteroidota bacterium]|nr:GNAT family N-acetyltransferase [Bacteroidota bacterium]
MLEIIELNNNNYKSLIAFLQKNKESYTFFHPHIFENSVVEKIIKNKKKDFYCLLTLNNIVIGYGMLRGMDEGYKIPSLGILVDNDYRSKGLGNLLINYLHVWCKINDYSKVRIKVYKHNKNAVNFYLKSGYTLVDGNENEYIGTKIII